MRNFSFRALAFAFAALWLAPVLSAADFDDPGRLLAGAAVLRTGSGSALIRTNLPWAANSNLTHPALVFAVGFGSDEAFVPGELFDSLTLTVRNQDRTFVAPALTADLFGLTLAPANPDGAQFREQDVKPEGLAFPPFEAPFHRQEAFLVLVVLPPALAGQSGT